MKTFDNLDRDDYWMGIAFIMAAGKNACLVVTANSMHPHGELISSGRDTILQSKNLLRSEIIAITSLPVDAKNSTIYMTNSPSYESYMTLVAAGIKRIVYYSSEPLGENLKSASKLEYVSLEEFTGNLNWMRDYIRTIA